MVPSSSVKRRPFQSIRTAFATACENAGITAETLNSNVGITNYHVHDSRHTFASRLVMRGVDLYRVQTLLGHKTARMTQRYAHLSPEGLREAVEALCVPTAAKRGPGLGPG